MFFGINIFGHIAEAAWSLCFMVICRWSNFLPFWFRLCRVRILDSVLRLTPSAWAASVTLRPNGTRQSSRRISPGWGGLCIFMVDSVVVFIINIPDEIVRIPDAVRFGVLPPARRAYRPGTIQQAAGVATARARATRFPTD